jgi:hypothetical protein
MNTTIVPVTRIRDGRRVDAEVLVAVDAAGPGRPVLIIRADWSARSNRWRSEDTYQLEPVPSAVGPSFILWRSAAAVSRDGEPSYVVTVDPAGKFDLCLCPGYQANGYCKHHDAIRGLIQAGHLEPAAAAPIAEDW